MPELAGEHRGKGVFFTFVLCSPMAAGPQPYPPLPWVSGTPPCLFRVPIYPSENFIEFLENEMREEVREIYTAVWQIHKRFYDIHSDSEWEALNTECEKLIKKHNTEFTRLLIQGMISELSSHNK